MIRVGAATETELKDKKHRVEDALSATRAAVEEGIVPGGGVALINAIEALDNVEEPYGDEQTGVNIVRRALEAPMRKISENSDRRRGRHPEGAQRAERKGQQQDRLQRGDQRVRRHD